MHILFVADGDDKYGAPHSMYQMIEELLKIDNKIKISVVLTRRSAMKAPYEALGCNVYPVSYQSFMHSRPEQKWKFFAKYILYGMVYYYGRICGIRMFEKKLDIRQVDIIHSNSSREDFGAQLALKYHKPLIWHVREFGDLDYDVYSYRKDFIRLMNISAVKLIAISDAVRWHWIKKGINEEKIERIYNGVTESIKRKESYKKAEGEPVRFLIMGSLRETKGQYQLIQAACHMSADERMKIRVDLVGGGKSRYINFLKKLIREENLEKEVHLLGYREDFYQEIAEYDCGIICARSEGFGRVTVEYMMAGLPVIASDAGANPEIVKNGENGLLYRFGDARDLKEKILALTENQSLREKMGRFASVYAMQNFTARQNAEKMYKEYQEILLNK